ncbi:hypothetical protein WOLCODRAFT_154159 [Wolfiporia cocos MD-104 SS10]|uniref:Uncharacterized protein n=1 Tax=Wolfiporia cocos (strain MD-104) TaxID=742152 RepID=A0A2H3K502_WOLCO|nr:hypothetical protein WOLCODRAFT_154159 [Wolfiporia cocos MD-104 SS10]
MANVFTLPSCRVLRESRVIRCSSSLTDKTNAINGNTGSPGSQQSGDDGPGSTHSGIGAIIGGVVCGFGGALIFALVAPLLYRCDTCACTPSGTNDMVLSAPTHAIPVSLGSTLDMAYEGVPNLPPSKERLRDRVRDAPVKSITNAPLLSIEPASAKFEEAGRINLMNWGVFRTQVVRLLRVVQWIKGGNSGSELDAPPWYTPEASGLDDGGSTILTSVFVDAEDVHELVSHVAEYKATVKGPQDELRGVRNNSSFVQLVWPPQGDLAGARAEG